MKKSVQDCGGQDLIASQNLRPFPDSLVEGNDCAGSLVAVIDHSEEAILSNFHKFEDVVVCGGKVNSFYSFGPAHKSVAIILTVVILICTDARPECATKECECPLVQHV